MFTFLLKRFYQAVIVMFVISLVAFSIQDNLGSAARAGGTIRLRVRAPGAARQDGTQ